MCKHSDHKDCKKDNYTEFDPFNIDHFIVDKDENNKNVYECITCEFGKTTQIKNFKQHTKSAMHKSNHLLSIILKPKKIKNRPSNNYTEFDPTNIKHFIVDKDENGKDVYEWDGQNMWSLDYLNKFELLKNKSH